MEDWVSNVILKWKSEGVKLNPPATIDDIENAEVVLNFKFPIDFKEFYLQANGFAGLDWQEHLFTLWPLEMIVKEFDEVLNKDFIGFCDYSLAVNCIGYSKTQAGIFKVYSGHQDLDFVTESFKESINLINSGAREVH